MSSQRSCLARSAPYQSIPAVPAEDRPIIAAALEGGAEYLVTDDAALLEPDAVIFDGVNVLFGASGAASACYGEDLRDNNGPSPYFKASPCLMGGFTCAPACSVCP